MSVYYLCYLDYVEIALTEFKDWSVAHYHPFKGFEIYKASTNWGLIKLLRKLLVDVKTIAQHPLGYLFYIVIEPL